MKKVKFDKPDAEFFPRYQIELHPGTNEIPESIALELIALGVVGRYQPSEPRIQARDAFPMPSFRAEESRAARAARRQRLENDKKGEA